MTHPTELQLSMYADNALSADDAIVVRDHVESCDVCRALLASARAEVGLLATAMSSDSPQDTRAVAIPKFSKPASFRGFALANVATGLLIWLGQFLWKTLFGEIAMNAATRITSIYLPDIYEMSSATLLYLLEEGTAMFDAYLGYIVVGMSAVSALWLLLKYRSSRATLSMCALVLLCTSLAAPGPVSALEIRRSEDVVTIPASETVDDTLIVAADTVLIQGKVTGDLVAAGRRVDISGNVDGNVLAFSDSVEISGTVGGSALGAASSFELDGATVGGNIWAAGETVIVDDESNVGQNAAVASQSASVEGRVGKDLYAFTEVVELSGEVGEDLEAFTNHVRLLGNAHVAGNVRIRSGASEPLHRDASVRVDGEVEYPELPEGFERKSRFATGEFYLWQVARLISAFLMGLFVLWLVPRLRSLSVASGADGIKTAGVGLLALVSVPVMAGLVAFTLVGLPFSVIAIMIWLVALYLAKILIGAYIGRTVMTGSDSLPVTLIAGLAIVIVAVNLPYIGGIINFVLTIVGLGLIVQYLWSVIAARDAESAV